MRPKIGQENRMNRLSRFASGVGFGVLAAMIAMPALAQTAPEAQSLGDAEPGAPKVERVKRLGSRLETVVVLAGAVDTDGQRWNDSGSRIATLPAMPESAFLEGEAEAQ
jgi:hypothetical protein